MSIALREPQRYRWSSHRFYFEPKQAPKWLQTEEVLGEFSGKGAFHRFVLEGNEEALEEFYAKGRLSPILGGEEFRRWLRLTERALRMGQEEPRHERAAIKPSVDQVLRTLSEIYGIKAKDLSRGRRGEENEPRKVGMYLLRELCDLRLQEIAGWFGLRSYGAVGWACHGVTSRMESDSKFRQRIARIQLICQQKT